MNIKKDESFFMLTGRYSGKDKKEMISCSFEAGGTKKFKRNKKEYNRLADHIGLMPLVMSCPNDILLILDGSEIRRRFMDSFLAQFDKPYLENLLQYQRAVSQRNALLKRLNTEKPDFTLLDALDLQLVHYGIPVYHFRKQFVSDFTSIFNECYNKIAGNSEAVSLDYISQLHHSDFAEILICEQGRDIHLGYSSIGPHKDDLHFLLAGRPVKRFASQGQQKTFLVALRFAQALYSASRKGIRPILLLDDIFDKLDSHRVEAIIHLVHDTDFGQIFITDTDHQRMLKILDQMGREYQIFEISNGKIVT